MKHFLKHIRMYIFRGLLAIIPLALVWIAIRILYELIDKKVMQALEPIFQVRHIPGMGILLILLCLYTIGVIASNVVGRQVFHIIGNITERIPIIKIIYQLGKQFSESFASAEKAFKKVLLVRGVHSEGWVVGLLAGTVLDENTKEELLRVFIPATHNPLLGYIVIVKAEQTKDPGWSVEETLKAMVSMGVIFPAEIKK